MALSEELLRKSNEDFWVKKLERASGSPLFLHKGPSSSHSCSFTAILPSPPLLEKVSNGKAINKYILFLTSMYLLISRYTGNTRQVIATAPFSETIDSGSPDGMLMFLVLQDTLKYSVKGLLKAIYEQIAEGYERINYDLPQLLERLTQHGLANRDALLEIGFHYESISQNNKLLQSVQLLFSVADANDGAYLIRVSYPEGLFTEEQVQRLPSHYACILAQVIENRDVEALKIDLLNAEEKQLLLHGFNSSNLNYNLNETILELFTRQVAQVPDQVALKYRDLTLSYRTLDEMTNRLANHLHSVSSIKPNDVVGVLIDHSQWRMICLLGVLKSGAAYLPIKADFPINRINFMLNDCSCDVLVTDTDLTHLAEQLEVKTKVYVSTDLSSASSEIGHWTTAKGNDLFVILYTSGSTGTPKGVMIEHGNILDRLLGEVALYELDEKIVTIQTSNYAFDSALLEFFLPIILGGRLVIPDEAVILDFERLGRLIHEEGITDLQANPHFLSSFIDICIRTEVKLDESLRRIWSGGESLNLTTLELVRKHFGQIMVSNHYGPTEGTIDVLVNKDVQLSAVNIIGKPIYNMQVYILDEFLNLQPIGIPGEICIAGKGLARGYLNLPELTRERFLGNPYINGQRLYRTGDLGRWLPEGMVEYMGRIDDQIKIRGYRIELGEVENVLIRQGSLRDVVVLPKTNDNGLRYLVAYVIGEPGKNSDTESLRAFLKKEVPEFMIPAYFIWLEVFPINTAGKVDKKVLLKMPLPPKDKQRHYVPPRNETEQRLVYIWEEVLGQKEIGIYSNFFEIGGQSLKAAQVLFRLHKELAVKLELKHIFDYPTVAELAGAIRATRNIDYKSISAAPSLAFYDASKAQTRIWLAHMLNQHNTTYSIMDAYTFKGELNTKALIQALNTIIVRHESLRTTFHFINEELKQKIHLQNDVHPVIDHIDLTTNDTPHKQIQEYAVNFACKPFDLAKGPLLRLAIVRLSEKEHVVLFSIHHIIVDEWSMRLFIEELLNLYRCYIDGLENNLPPLKVQYKDYSEWYKQVSLADQETYWLKAFSGYIPRLNLPTDYPYINGRGKEGKTDFLICKEGLAALHEIARSEGSTLYITLLAIFNVLLHKICGQEDIVIGTVMAGRNHPDLESLIGYFVNTVVLRNYPQGHKTFREFLSEVRNSTLRSFEYQDYPFENLVEKIEKERLVGRSPIFDVLFEFQDQLQAQLPGLVIEDYVFDYVVEAKFDLILTAVEQKDSILFTWTYNQSLFKETTLQKISGYLIRLIEYVTDRPNASLLELNLLDEKTISQFEGGQDTLNELIQPRFNF